MEKHVAASCRKENFEILLSKLDLADGARVLVTVNEADTHGITNGARCEIKYIVYDNTDGSRAVHRE